MNKKEHLSAPGVLIAPNRKLGYYLVDHEIYYHKIQALLAASKNQSQVRWFFNEDTFISYPWHIEPEATLNELYRRRAQQLRDTYDYIRLELSGGADSATVLYSFVLNGIHIDEVVFRYPKQGEKGVVGNPYDTRCENTLSEWEFAARPLLNWIATNYPQVKITVHDYSEDMIKESAMKDETWIYKTRHYLQPGHAHKHDNSHDLSYLRLADKNKRIAVVYGTDKPKICIKDKKFFLFFMDIQGNYANTDYGDHMVTAEYFYWSPDACELLAKQAHVIARWFSQPENYKMQNLLHWPNNNFAFRSFYEQLVKLIIYPDYDSSTFQTLKPTNNFYNEMDHWFHTNFKDTRLYTVWQAGIDYVVQNLDSKYIGYTDGVARDIISFDTPYYYFGECNIPENIAGVRTRELFLQHKDEIHRQHRHAIHGKLVIY